MIGFLSERESTWHGLCTINRSNQCEEDSGMDWTRCMNEWGSYTEATFVRYLEYRKTVYQSTKTSIHRCTCRWSKERSDEAGKTFWEKTAFYRIQWSTQILWLNSNKSRTVQPVQKVPIQSTVNGEEHQ